METIETLQVKLERKAKDKLRNDIKEYLSSFRKNNLFKAIADKEAPGTRRNFSDWTYYEGNDTCFGIIFNKMLPEYIEAESKEFLSKVENLQEELDDLRNKIQ